LLDQMAFQHPGTPFFCFDLTLAELNATFCLAIHRSLLLVWTS